MIFQILFFGNIISKTYGNIKCKELHKHRELGNPAVLNYKIRISNKILESNFRISSLIHMPEFTKHKIGNYMGMSSAQ